ncbi:unnamed protein product [Owenia fusiformis]|uniref:Uncharacterized protein n=1 Tax=Owenia fusiformis TaxID=6347 RepID=A0A8J1Y0Q6_OWEFU|nr:unnamed protein product [Owenia fusiformis]
MDERSPLIQEGNTIDDYCRDDQVQAPVIANYRRYPNHEDKAKPDKNELMDSQNSITDDSTNTVILYKRRWYILILFSLVSTTQAAVWNTFGPIGNSVKFVFGWSDGILALPPALGNVAYFIFPFTSWVMDDKGMRVAMVGATLLMFCGTALRCITTSPTAATWLIMTGQLLNGLAGPVPFGGPSLMSSLWFPTNQRTTATAIAAIFSYVGDASSFMLGIAFVSEPSSANSSLINASSYANTSGPPFLDQQKGEILNLMYTECAVCGVLFLLVLIYFPDKPPTPPSASASKDRVDFKKGFGLLIRKPQFWLVGLAYSLPTGIFGSWVTILDINLGPIGIEQNEASLLGFYATVGGIVAGFVMSGVADCLSGQLKRMLVVLASLSLGSVVWFCVIWMQTANSTQPADKVQLYTSIVLMGVFINGGIPLLYELACETCFPVAEGITGGMLTGLNTTIGMIFLLLLFIPNIGAVWMNWCLLGSCVLSIPLLLSVTANYARLDIDKKNQSGIS